MAGTPLQIIVGLGNPGPEHRLTRHNAGFWFVDLLAESFGARFKEERKFNADLCRIQIGNNEVRLLKPMTYMNRSGQSIQAVCNYFKCKAIRVSIGQPGDQKNTKLLDDWMNLVSTKSLSANVAPCFELSLSLPVVEPAAIASLLNKHKRWSIIYDPAVLIMPRKMDPFTRYWSLLKQRVSHLDVHDFLIGKSPKPPGHGDAKLDLTLADAIGSRYRGWYCLEPGMGRRYGSITNKSDVFLNALCV